MATEIEIKLKVPDHAPVRARLVALGATTTGITEETNTFLDTTPPSLSPAKCGLRLRRNHHTTTATDTHVLTYKGPRRPGVAKTREELETAVTDPDTTLAILDRLGFRPTLTFAKRRETWHLDGCTVELDTLDPLGTFVEIEGPDEATVLAVRARLDLAALTPIGPSYASMLAALHR